MLRAPFSQNLAKFPLQPHLPKIQACFLKPNSSAIHLCIVIWTPNAKNGQHLGQPCCEHGRRDSYIDKAREEVDFITATILPPELANEDDWDSPEAAHLGLFRCFSFQEFSIALLCVVLTKP